MHDHSEKISLYFGENNFNTKTLNCSARNRVFMLYCKLYMMFKKSTTLIDQACAANCCCFLKAWGLSRNTLKYFIKFFPKKGSNFLIPIIIPLSISHIIPQKFSKLKR